MFGKVNRLCCPRNPAAASFSIDIRRINFFVLDKQTSAQLLLVKMWTTPLFEPETSALTLSINHIFVKVGARNKISTSGENAFGKFNPTWTGI